jgi:hypothetical protein
VNRVPNQLYIKYELEKWAVNFPAVIDQHYRALVRGDKERAPLEYAWYFFKEYFFIIDSKSVTSIVYILSGV